MNNPPIYLDFGGALTAFGLIFAVYQLRRPKWDVVLSIRSRWQEYLFGILGGAGLLLILIRVIITQLPIGYFPYPFNLGASYEMLAYLFFIASPLALLYFANRTKGLFNKNNHRRFYDVITSEIARFNEEGLNSCLDILLSNFNEICRAATQQDFSEIKRSAISILNVALSDQSIASLVGTKRLDALQYVFTKVEEYGISPRECGIGIPKIVNTLFYDKNSYLYKQLENHGLALSWNLYETIFGSPSIVNNFDLFGYPSVDYVQRKKLDVSGIEVLIKSLSKSIEVYLREGVVLPRQINNGFSYLSDIFQDISFKIGVEDHRGVDTKYAMKEEWDALNKIADFLGHDYLFLAHNLRTQIEETLPEITARENTTQEAGFFSTETIGAGVAASIYKAFISLTYIKKSDDIYFTILQLTHGMSFEQNAALSYRAAFEKRMWEQIANNVIKKIYPAALKTYLIPIGFQLASEQVNQTGWLGEQAERMRRLLYVDLKPLINNDEKMVNGELMKGVLLPDFMTYEDGNFTYTLEFGAGRKVIIQPPPEGSVSALVGVALDNMSLI